MMVAYLRNTEGSDSEDSSGLTYSTEGQRRQHGTLIRVILIVSDTLMLQKQGTYINSSSDSTAMALA